MYNEYIGMDEVGFHTVQSTNQILRELKQGDLSPLEEVLLIHFRNIWDEYLQKVAVDQVRVLGEFDPKAMIWDLVDIVSDEKEHQENLKNYLKERKRKR